MPNQTSFVGFISQLNQAHRSRFSHFSKGKHVKIKISDGTVVDGVIDSISGDGISVDNQGSTAGGHSQVVTVTWIDIIKEL